MEISVKSNIKQLIQQMNNAEKKQVPYATSLALNAVAVKAQENVQKSIEGKFNNRKKWWLRQQPTGVKVKFTDRRKDNLKKSSVFLGPKNWWGDLQEKGGTKKGKRGNTTTLHRNCIKLPLISGKIKLFKLIRTLYRKSTFKHSATSFFIRITNFWLNVN